MMDLTLAIVSPPYDDEELFPDLVPSIQKLGDIPTSLFSKVTSEADSFDTQNASNVSDEEDVDMQMLRSSYHKQNPQEKSPAISPNFDRKGKFGLISPLSNVSSSTPETVVVLIDQMGQEKKLRGPNRNAIMAKLNRERKKKAMSGLEDTVNDLTSQNRNLRENQAKLTDRVHSLEAEVDYLKGVLANQSEIADMLNNMKATNLSFHTSIGPSVHTAGIKRPAETNGQEHCKRMKNSKVSKTLKVKTPFCIETIKYKTSGYPERIVKSEWSTPQKSALYEESLREKAVRSVIPSKKVAKGVCLHVKNRKVSLEFCSSCSQRAEMAYQQDGVA